MSAVGRPKDVPLKREGRFTYVRLGDRLIAFPAETATQKDLECIKAINAGYAKGIDTELDEAQHKSLIRLLHGHAISFDSNWR